MGILRPPGSLWCTTPHERRPERFPQDFHCHSLRHKYTVTFQQDGRVGAYLTVWKEVEDCCVLRYGSTQRSQISEEAVQLTGHTTYQATRASDSGKARGRGLCVYTNNRRCTHTKITNTQCSPDLKYLTVMCRPFYLPGELRGNDYYCLHPPFKLTWL